MQGAQKKPALSCGRNWWPYIHTVFDKFATQELAGIFTDSLYSLHAILHRYTHLGTRGPQNYHHHLFLLNGLTDLLEERRRRGSRTTFHKIRAHANIRGFNLKDAAAKMAVTQYDSLSESQKLKVDIREIAPHPPHWVMYTVSPPLSPTQLETCTRMVTLRQPWWSIPEGGRLQMHAFMRPSHQL